MMLRERPSYQRRIARIKVGLKRLGVSQSRAAMDMGFSPTLLCQVLRLQSTSRPMVERCEAWITEREAGR